MAAAKLTPEEKDRERRLKWFKEARFGMFVHWGLYAQLGRHEWVMNRERIPIAEYEPLAKSFKPKPWPASRSSTGTGASGRRAARRRRS